jgi:hypothetical protein
VHSGTGGHNVVQDDPTLAEDRHANEEADVAMVLHLLAVVREPDGARVHGGERECRSGSEWDSLVRWTKENVEFGKRGAEFRLRGEGDSERLCDGV